MGPVSAKFEQRGFKLVAMKLCSPGAEHFKKHYADLSDKPFFEKLVKFASSGPVVAMVFEGDNVIKTGRRIIGATNSMDRNMGTLRGDLSVITSNNIIHGSDCPEAAEAEIKLWFKDEELVTFNHHSQAWIYE